MEAIWKKEGFFLGDDDFLKRMSEDIADFRKEHYREGAFCGYKEAQIHYVYLKHPKERAAVVISHGFCEFIRKYDELIYYFYRMGYSVYMPEHRGHGDSCRLTDDSDKVHVESFSDYVEDFRIFIDSIVKKKSPDAKLLLFAHSMGGCIGALFLEKYPEVFSGALLSSPMFEMYYGSVPKGVVWLLTGAAALLGKSKAYVPGKHGFDNVYVFSTSSTLSEPRYRYAFGLRQQTLSCRTYGATYGWTRAAMKASKQALRDAGRIRIPVLVTQAGLDAMVQPKAQEKFVSRVSGAKLKRFPESKHEIFNALAPVREAYWNTVFSFFEQIIKPERMEKRRLYE